MAAFAEVIGDPIAHSKSPAIHRFWLEALSVDGDYRATRVNAEGLATFFADRRRDPDWRGCNVTAPHKQAVIPFLDAISPDARRIGAVNCVHAEEGRLVGLNTDVDGIAEALAGAAIEGGRAVVIGAGGGARAAVRYLAEQRPRSIVVIARTPGRGEDLLELGAVPGQVEVVPTPQADLAVAGAAAIINATPAGMAHAEPMPPALLAALDGAPRAVVLDMVYQPLLTPFLAAAEAAGATPVDGLTMLIGQARKAFELFFGAVPPGARDGELRRILTSSPERGLN